LTRRTPSILPYTTLFRSRERLDRLQRRGLQPRRAPARSRSPWPPLPDAERHRDGPAPLRGRRGAVRRAPPGDVRVRPVGPEGGSPPSREGSARDQTALLRRDRARAAVRVGDQTAPGRGPHPPRVERRAPPGLPRDALRLRRGATFPCPRAAPPR